MARTTAGTRLVAGTRTTAGTRFLNRAFGSALSLNGAGNTNVTSASVPNQNNSFTMAAWIYPTALANNIMTFDALNTPDLVLQSGGNLRMSKLGSGGFANSSSIIVLRRWQHIMFTINSGTTNYAYYINGVAAGTGSSAQSFDLTHTFLVGQEAGFGANWNGLMDEVMYWDTSLTATEAASVYFQGTTPQSANLRIYYKFDEGTGTTVANSAGVSNTGTLNGAGALWSTNVVSVARSAA